MEIIWLPVAGRSSDTVHHIFLRGTTQQFWLLSDKGSSGTEFLFPVANPFAPNWHLPNPDTPPAELASLEEYSFDSNLRKSHGTDHAEYAAPEYVFIPRLSYAFGYKLKQPVKIGEGVFKLFKCGG